MPFSRRLQALADTLRVRHVRGPRRMPAGVILLCRVENGEEWIPQFLAHYRALGVAHMMFLDTGSTDRTVDLLQGKDITVYRTSLPFKTHRLWMRRWLMHRCPPHTWTLNVDVDELLLYPPIMPPPLTPPSGETDIAQLVAYLDHHHFTAMRAHMLDMFASGPVGSRDAADDAPLLEQYPYYDLSDIHPIAGSWIFREGQSWMGGIRKTVFGRDHFWLTKHPLIKTGHNIRAFEDSEHGVIDAHVADITGVLLHFKFTPSFRQYVEESVRRGQHWNDSAEYKAYQSLLAEHPDLSLKRATAWKWSGIDALVGAGFIHAAGSSTIPGTGASAGAE
jgi:hypothetical protein